MDTIKQDTDILTINKVVRLGTSKTRGGRSFSTFCRIKYNNGRLSITGVEGPLSSGNCLGGCGQIIISGLNITNLAGGWTRKKLAKFAQIWDKWHLNDMQAGTPSQTALLDQYKQLNPVWRYDSGFACDLLKQHHLLEDNGYRYGTASLKIDVPQDVLQFLADLPSTDKTPAWI